MLTRLNEECPTVQPDPTAFFIKKIKRSLLAYANQLTVRVHLPSHLRVKRHELKLQMVVLFLMLHHRIDIGFEEACRGVLP